MSTPVTQEGRSAASKQSAHGRDLVLFFLSLGSAFILLCFSDFFFLKAAAKRGSGAAAARPTSPTLFTKPPLEGSLNNRQPRWMTRAAKTW
jgi:hypothetical protein